MSKKRKEIMSGSVFYNWLSSSEDNIQGMP